VRIENAASPPRTFYLWLGDIAMVERLDTA